MTSILGLFYGVANAGYLTCLTSNFTVWQGTRYAVVSCSTEVKNSAGGANTAAKDGCKEALKGVGAWDSNVIRNTCDSEARFHTINTDDDSAVAGAVVMGYDNGGDKIWTWKSSKGSNAELAQYQAQLEAENHYSQYSKKTVVSIGADKYGASVMYKNDRSAAQKKFSEKTGSDWAAYAMKQ